MLSVSKHPARDLDAGGDGNREHLGFPALRLWGLRSVARGEGADLGECVVTVRYLQEVASVVEALGLDEPALRAALVQLLAVPSGARVLDVGSGPGSSLPALTAAGLSAICLDVDADMLTGIAGVPRVQGTAIALPVQTACVDAALCVGVLHAVAWSRESLAELFLEIARVVRPGGRVVIANKGLAPWRVHTAWYAHARAVLGAEACDLPPVWLLPPTAADVTVRWDWGTDAFYAMTFQVRP